MKTVCFTGHRPDKLYGYDIFSPLNSAIEIELDKIIKQSILEGYDTFISGGALGVDQMAAHNVVAWRDDEFPNIKLIIARPFPSQACKWPKTFQNYFDSLCKSANEVIDVSPDPYAAWKMQKRNIWMVDNSDLVIAVWDGSEGGTGTCIRYAESKNKKIIRINPLMLKEG